MAIFPVRPGLASYLVFPDNMLWREVLWAGCLSSAKHTRLHLFCIHIDSWMGKGIGLTPFCIGSPMTISQASNNIGDKNLQLVVKS